MSIPKSKTKLTTLSSNSSLSSLSSDFQTSATLPESTSEFNSKPSSQPSSSRKVNKKTTRELPSAPNGKNSII